MAARSTGALQSQEHPKGSGIKIREIINAHKGEAYGVSYQVVVPAKLTGTVRSRMQFPTLKQAEDYAEKEHSGARKQGEAYFSLTDQERQEAATWLPKLREKGITLSEAAAFALENLAGTDRSITALALYKEILANKTERFQRGDLRKHTIKDFRLRGKGFAEAMDGKPLVEISPSDMVTWLKSIKGTTRTVKNHLRVASDILNEATARGFIAKSPVGRISNHEMKLLCGNDESGEPHILTVDEAQRLLETAREHESLGMLAPITLGLFCGLRTEEIKLLQWDAVKDGESSPIVTIGSGIAKKRRIRHVDIPENALAWLSLCTDRNGAVTRDAYSDDYNGRFRKLTKLAGIQWQRNAMRHSFGSYHYAMHGNPLETARLLGHKANDQVLFDHYRALATKAEAKKYFQL